MTEPFPPHAAPQGPPSQVPPTGAPAGPFAPAGPVTPTGSKGKLRLWLIVAGVVVVVLAVGTPILVSQLKTDSGVTACRTVAKPATAANSQPAMARATNRTVRGQFADSGYADLRTAGGHYVDAMDGMLAPYGTQPKAGTESVPKAWTELTDACGNHGVTLPSLVS
ncbi:hypothetical protein [Rugosimonospora africana]|uniref:Uncharacterized protein n=1 Tax=Rugosimonospora africana TaxID=556532 RepID=A0A8J3VWG4_9ACTN|nr:hypothetical protein [Rugosimonospora africana]GIH20743.1 hypothetical protein Raf01_89150 [Rugosimonospora africana]